MRHPDSIREYVLDQFKALRSLAERVEGSFVDDHHAEQARIHQDFEPIIKAASDAGEDERGQEFSRDCWMAESDRRYDEFRRLQRFSLLAMTFTLLEWGLTYASKEIIKRKSLQIDWESIGDPCDGIFQRFKLFWKLARLPQLYQRQKWDRADKVRALRNVVAHRYGWPASENAQRGSRDDRIVDSLIEENIGVRRVKAFAVVDDIVMTVGTDRPIEVGAIKIEQRFCAARLSDFESLLKEVFDRAGCFQGTVVDD